MISCHAGLSRQLKCAEGATEISFTGLGRDEGRCPRENAPKINLPLLCEAEEGRAQTGELFHDPGYRSVFKHDHVKISPPRRS